MRDLLDLVVASHGGIERWNSIQVIDGDMSITGGLWARKGWPNALEQVHVTARTRDQWISYRPFTAQNKRSRCTPDHTAIETLDGQMIKERHNPRSAFADHTAETKWDDLNLAYFSGFAMWNCLTTPFLLTTPGFETEELAPWSDNGNERRRLKVTFPSSIATHCPEQVFHVDRDNLIARVDYFSQITGGVAAAHYLTDYKDFAESDSQPNDERIPEIPTALQTSTACSLRSISPTSDSREPRDRECDRSSIGGSNDRSR